MPRTLGLVPNEHGFALLFGATWRLMLQLRLDSLLSGGLLLFLLGEQGLNPALGVEPHVVVVLPSVDLMVAADTRVDRKLLEQGFRILLMVFLIRYLLRCRVQFDLRLLLHT